MTDNTNTPINSKLTVYSQSSHIIQQYPNNTESISLRKSAHIDSILVIDSLGNIIPFDYISPINWTSVLTER